jgi:hypothetical protein
MVRQLAALRQGPPVHESAHQEGRSAGVGLKDEASIVTCFTALFLRA